VHIKVKYYEKIKGEALIAVLEFDEGKVLTLIKKELGHDWDDLARNIMNQLKTFHEELHPYINAWINGKKPSFNFHGISIEEVMEKTHRPYILACGCMDLILENPEEWVNWYKTYQLKLR
jgi:hypothetical protein